MGQQTAIEWAHHTFNPWRGCEKIDAGCANCYAAVDMSVKLHGIRWGSAAQGGMRVVLAEGGWQNLRRWNRAAQADGVRRRVFVASLADVFEPWEGPISDHHGDRLAVDPSGRWRAFGSTEHAREAEFLRDHGRWLTMQDVRRRLFAEIDRAPWLDFLLLTKRPQEIRDNVPEVEIQRVDQEHDARRFGTRYRRNVWLGASASNSETAPKLLSLMRCRDLTPVLFCSAEPLVGPLAFGLGGPHGLGWWEGTNWIGLDWVIVGGESGPHARRINVRWVEQIVRECRADAIPVFVKQLGARPYRCGGGHDSPAALYGRSIDCGGMAGYGCSSISLRDAKGGDPDEWPEHLRVRETPERHGIGATIEQQK